VAYDSDVDRVLQLLTQAAAGQERVVLEPAPSANLSQLGPDGLEFTLNFWIADPENGQLNVRSLVNLAILKALRANGVEISVASRLAQPHRM
jgi:small-conductance mechanosensitive channel